MVTFSIFIQAALDNNIILDDASQDYTVKHRCDKFGMLNYMNIIKDLTIKTQLDVTGSIQARWHLKQLISGAGSRPASQKSS